jgi:hypothetical protein
MRDARVGDVYRLIGTDSLSRIGDLASFEAGISLSNS